MENTVDDVQTKLPDSNVNDRKRKCLTQSEYNTIISQIDSWINDSHFILNKYGQLTTRALGEFSQ